MISGLKVIKIGNDCVRSLVKRYLFSVSVDK